MGCSTSKVEVSRSTDSTGKEDDFVEGVVCKDSDVGEDEMKTFDLGDAGKVLLVRHKGQLSALGTKCTHYGAPLVGGALGDGRVRCQWHGACFNVLNGDIEDFPGLDSLPCYQVTVADSEVKVRARRSELEANKRTKPMTKQDPRESQHIVVVGGGPSGATCVETLRQEGFSGKISLICKENHLPYDRVLVSKSMDFDINKAQFRSEAFYNENGIDIVQNVAARALNTEAKSLELSSGATLNYDRLYLATGQSAKKIAIPGADLRNVVVLRDYEHAHEVNALLSPTVEVVILGSSFVAMEAADYCSNKAKSVTVVGRSDVPFKQLLGSAIGGAFKKLFEEKGVRFATNSGISRCIDDGQGQVARVELKDGATINADLVIMGVGSTCNTDFLRDSGVDLNSDGSVEVDGYLQTNVQGVYAGGDIAHAPVWSHHGDKSTIGHYSLAHYHGRIAALNMLGKQTPLKVVPYFWTKLFGKSVRYAGHGNYDEIVYIGDVDKFKFVAYYLDGDGVVAASSCGMDPVVSQFAELLAQGVKLRRGDVENDEKFQWAKKLRSCD